MGGGSSTQTIRTDTEVQCEELDYNKLESTNKELTKITELHDQSEQLKNKSELKYESVPIIQCISTIFDQSTKEEENINKLLNKLTNNPAIHEEINKLKANINNHRSNLPDNITSTLLDAKADEIKQLETEIKQEEHAMQESLEKNLKQLKKTMENLSLSISQHLSKAEKEISTISKNITEMQPSSKYEKIKNMLLEQENKILTLQVDTLTSRSNLDSNPSSHFGNNGEKRMLFCNIPEETNDPRCDYEKVQEILKLFNGVSNDSIKRVFRVGARTPRSLKVIFSDNEAVDTILKQRRCLKNSPHSNVRIYDI